MKNKFYLDEQNFDIELPGAEITYNLDTQQQTIVTESVPLSIDLGQLLIPQGGWLMYVFGQFSLEPAIMSSIHQLMHLLC